MRRRRCIAFFTAAFLAAPVAAPAHVTLSPAQGTTGSRQAYVLRMPNERRVDTVKLDLFFSSGMKPASFQQVAGWVLQLERDATGAIIAAHWTGALPPDQYVELGLMVVNPNVAGEVRLLARQTYANGEVVEWSGEAGSKAPAPHVQIVATAPAVEHAGH
jgi:uncharacterized protein YcnI